MWNPLSGMGVPFLANNESGLFNFLNILDFIYSDMESATLAKYLIAQFLGCLSCFLFLRLIGASLLASYLGVILFIQGSYFSIEDPMLMAYYARNFTMVSLYLLYSSHFLKDTKKTLLYILSLGILLLCGDLHIGGIGFGLCLFVAITRFKKKSDFIKILYHLLPPLMAAPQIIPTLELIHHSIRQWSAKEIISNSAIDFTEIINWIMGHHGILFILPFIAIFIKDHKELKTFFIIVLLAIIFSLGGYVYKGLYFIIGFIKHLNISEYYLISPLSLLIPLMIAIAIDIIYCQYRFKKTLFFIFIIIMSYQQIKSFNYIINNNSQKAIFPRENCVDIIKKNIGDGALLRFRTNAFASNLPMYFGIRDLHYYDALILKNYVEYLKKIDSSFTSELGPSDIKIKEFQSKDIFSNSYLQLLSPSIILSGVQLQSPSLTPLTEKSIYCYNPYNPIYIYKTPLTHSDIYSTDHINDPLNLKKIKPVRYKKSILGSDHIFYELNKEDLRKSKYIFFTKTKYPGWSMTSKLKNHEILTAFGLFQAIEISSSFPSEISMRFIPTHQKWTLSVSISIFLFIILFLILLSIRKNNA